MSIPTKTVEFLGPPGAGKSALVTALCGSNQDVGLVHTYCGFRTLIPWLRAGISLSPLLLLGPTKRRRAIKWRAWVIRLEASASILGHVRSRKSVLVFDQGPLYTMARLREVPPHADRPGRWERWWEEKVSTWANLLDIVFVLDASDEELLRRIRARPKKHLIEGYAENKARDRLKIDRQLYEHVVRELQLHGDTRVVRLDTSLETVEEAAAEVMADLRLGMPQGTVG